MTATPPGLIVYVGGLNEKADQIGPLLARLGQLPELRNFDVYIYSTRLGTFSRGGLAERADNLADAIANYWDTQGKPSTVVLMGHSIGGLLVRHAYLAASGAFQHPAHDWVRQVSRIVLFAAPNQGIETRRLRAPLRWLISMALSVTHGWSAADAIRGTPFLANLRIQWMRTIPAMQNPPLVIQVRGTEDREVLKEDSIDLEAMPNSRTVSISGADHWTIILPSRTHEDREGEQFELLANAVTGDFHEDPDLAPKVRPPTTCVVFLLHGIRAGIFGWVGRLHQILTSKASSVAVQHSSYGYLSAYKFALPWGHDRQLRLFADWYTQMLSKHGSVDFHFVGHSNGTYIFGRSLQRVSTMTFDRVYLAGSVLPSDFSWTRHSGQVKEVVNACGRTDAPVGWLCRALRGLGRRDLGTGGYAGFDDTSMVRQYVKIEGGHGAGLTGGRLPAVAEYVLDAIEPSESTAGDPGLWTCTDSPGWFDTLSKFSGWLARFLSVGCLVGLAVLILAQLWVAVAISLGAAALVLIILSAI